MTWPMVALGEVAEIERTSVSPGSIADGTRYVGLEHIPSGGDFVDHQIVKAGDIASNKFTFDERHILYGKLRPYLAKIVRPSFSGICSTDILPVRPGSRVDRGFLTHFLKLPEQVLKAASRSSGANLPRLSPTALAGFEIPLPPLPEQRRIARILDAADALCRRRRATIEALDTLQGALFAEMFGDLSLLNDVRPLKDVAHVQSGITKGRKLKDRAETYLTPYLAVSNVQDKSLDLSVVKTIEATESERAKFALRAGDLVLTEGGDPDKLGRGTIWQDEIAGAIHQNHIFRVRLVSSDVLAGYVSHLASSPFGKAYFFRMAKQTTGIASINKTQLSALPIPIPSISLQSAFVRASQRSMDQRAAMAAHLAHLDALFAALQSRAFAGDL